MIIRATTILPMLFTITQHAFAQTINEQDAVLETALSPAMLNKKMFVGSGIADTVFIPTLTAYGTDTSINELYSEPDATDITTYVVRTGDTIDSVAKLFKVSPNTIRWQNDIKKGQPIKLGQELIILPVSGVMHTIKKGDTLAKIAKMYGGEVLDLKNFNGIESDSELIIGKKIIIPNGEKQEVVAPPKTIVSKITRIFTMPFTRGKWNHREMVVNGFMHPTKFAGIKTQGFHHQWRAIDIGLPIGTPIYASKDGVIKIANRSGFGGGYGLYVYIEHSDGSGTMYAHLNRVHVRAGNRVSQGEHIGDSGNTGRSTGPHLHYEIRPPRGKSVSKWFPIPW
jgi:murein DD-endopeptidase MepM/ murein hydrolase activator NlpD